MTTVHDETGPRLADLARQDVPVAAWCLDCGHHRVLNLASLRWPAWTAARRWWPWRGA